MRGQSETVGFILVFSLIAVSTGVVYVGGFSTLENVRTAEELNNMERAFEVLDDNMHDISERGAPSRATELSLGGGDIGLGGTTSIAITARYESNGTEAANSTAGVRPVVYSLDETDVVYSSGAVLRSDRGDAGMRSEPGWVVTDRRTVIPLLVTSPAPGGQKRIGGDTTILVLAERSSRNVAVEFDPRTTRVNVSVTVESSRAGAWKRFLEDEGFTAVDGDPDDDTLTYWFVTDELYVPRTSVQVDFKP